MHTHIAVRSEVTITDIESAWLGLPGSQARTRLSKTNGVVFARCPTDGSEPKSEMASIAHYLAGRAAEGRETWPGADTFWRTPEFIPPVERTTGLGARESWDVMCDVFDSTPIKTSSSVDWGHDYRGALSNKHWFDSASTQRSPLSPQQPRRSS